MYIYTPYIYSVHISILFSLFKVAPLGRCCAQSGPGPQSPHAWHRGVFPFSFFLVVLIGLPPLAKSGLPHRQDSQADTQAPIDT